VGVSVVAGVESCDMSSDPSGHSAEDGFRMRVHMLGPLSIVRSGVALALPASRKVRALIAYLALAPRPVGRSRLCELLWDIPNDPRGELRWCLSKVRSVLDEPGRRRVETRADAIALDLSDCFVDVLEIGRATQEGIDRLAPEHLRALAALFAGDFLEGLEIDRSPEFSGWLTAQRCRLRGCRAAVLEHLVASTGPKSDEVFGHLDEWLQIAPFDRRAHAMLLDALAVRGRMHEGDAHVSATVRLFESEGLDGAPLRESWKLSRARQSGQVAHLDVLRTTLAVPPSLTATGALAAAPRRASIAVIPFSDCTGDPKSPLADGLAHDLITRLAKLRNLFVIAHGTTSVLGARGIGAEDAGRVLNVDYVAGGSLRRSADRVTVTVELSEARSARIVWTDEFHHRLDDAFQAQDEIGNRIVASIASEIELAERNRAILRPPNSLNAWEAFHRGLWHMYRYESQHNRLAAQFFEMAVKLDPTWARALSALSFTHFQNAFQRWTEREPEIDLAFRAAEQSLVADDRDPSAHWAMGRALWLRGRHAQSLVELEKAVELSPSFAHGHYTLAFVHAQSGDPALGIGCSDLSRELSPFDPLLCVMLTARAIALVRLGRFDEAADWAVKGANRPNTFAHLRAVAAACLGLAGRHEEGREVAAALHAALPYYRVDDLLTTFQFAPDAAALLGEGARRSGLT
jgi:DNA-binding SARP family transcriptional activator/TolB-like protein